MSLVKEVPCGGEAVTILHMLSPDTYWISELAKSSSRTEVNNLETHINRQNETGRLNTIVSPMINQLVAVQNSKKWWCRGKIVDVTFIGDTQYEVLLIDYGISLKVNKCDLRELSSEFKSLSPQAFKFIIYGVIPATLSLGFDGTSKKVCETWSRSSVEHIKELLNNCHVGYVLPKAIHAKQKIIYGTLYISQEEGYIDLCKVLCELPYAIYDETLFEEKFKFNSDDIKAIECLNETPNIKDSASEQIVERSSWIDTQKMMEAAEKNSAKDKKVTQGSEKKPAQVKKLTKGSEKKPAEDKKLTKGSEKKPAEDKVSPKFVKQAITPRNEVSPKFVKQPISPRNEVSLMFAKQAIKPRNEGVKTEDLDSGITNKGELLCEFFNRMKGKISGEDDDIETTPLSNSTASSCPSGNVTQDSQILEGLVSESPERKTSNKNFHCGRNGLFTPGKCMPPEYTSRKGYSNINVHDRGHKIQQKILSPSDSYSTSSESNDSPFSKVSKEPEFKRGTSEKLETYERSKNVCGGRNSRGYKQRSSFTSSENSEREINTSGEYESYQKLLMGSSSFEQNMTDSANINQTTNIIDQFQTILVLAHGVDRDYVPYKNKNDANLLHEIYEMLGRKMSQLTRIQKFAWPVIAKGRNIVMIAPSHCGKTMAYVVPILNTFALRKNNGEIPKGNGPVILVLCSGSSNTQNVASAFEQVARLLRKVKIVAAYGNGAELEVVPELMNGCDILVTTPCCLSRLILQGNFVFNFNRLNCFVLDEADVLTLKFFPEIEKICCQLEGNLKKRPKENLGLQVIVSAQKWCPGVEIITKTLSCPVVCICAYLETIVYGRLKPKLHMVTKCNRVSILVDLLKKNLGKHKTIVACRSVPEVKEIANAFEHELVFTAHDQMENFSIHNILIRWKLTSKKGKFPILVCTDSVLRELRIQDATQLIHYSLPSEFKSQFAFRFTCLLESIPNILKDNSQNDADQPIIHIFVHDTDSFQLPTLVQFLKRLDVEIDSDLLQRSNMAEEEKEHTKDTLPLCYNIKAFGDCWNRVGCIYRHKLGNQDNPKNIPRQGTVKIKILHIHDPCSFSARLLEHTDANGHTTPVPNLSITIFRKMHKYFKEESNQTLVDNPKARGIYAIKKGDAYTRVQVLSIRYTAFKMESSILVRFVDDGYIKLVKLAELFELPEELKEIPPQSVEIFLCCLCPHDFDWSWGETATSTVKKIMAVTGEKDKYLVGIIKLSLGNTIWVDPLVCYQILHTVKTNALTFSVRRRFLEENLAVENEQHLQILYKACKESGIELPPPGTESKPVKKKLKQTVKIQWAFLPSEFEAVTFIVGDSPERFYVRRNKFEDCVSRLNKQIQKLVESKKAFEEPAMGDYCVGKFPSDSMWYRARIQKVEEDAVELFFLDHGDCATVPMTDIHPIPEYLITKLPFQAIECSLAAVDRDETTHWSDKAFDTLYDLCVNENQDVYNDIYAKVIGRTKSEMCVGSYKYHIVLVDATKTEKIIINKAMIEMGVAKQLEEQEEILENLDLSELCFETPMEEESSDDEIPHIPVKDAELLLENPEIIDSEQPPVSEQKQNNSLENTQALQTVNGMHNFDWENCDSEDCFHFYEFVRDQMKAQDSMKAIENSVKAASCEESSLSESDESETSSYNKDTNSSSVSEENSPPPLLSTTRTPLTLWHQDNYCVWLRVNLPGLEKYHLSWDIFNLEFWAVVEDEVYTFDIELFGSMNPYKLEHSSGGLYVKIKLYKLFVGCNWPRLLKKQGKVPWLQRNLDAELKNEEEVTPSFGGVTENTGKGKKDLPLLVDESDLEDDTDEEGDDSDVLYPVDEQYDPYDPLN